MTEPMTMIQELKTRILNGGMISREEALLRRPPDPAPFLPEPLRPLYHHQREERPLPGKLPVLRPIRLFFFQRRGISSAGC